jgi:hypothetical protein
MASSGINATDHKDYHKRPRAQLSLRNIEWIAGLLEGEGCFSLTPSRPGSASIVLGMTDHDVVQRFAGHLGCKVRTTQPGNTALGKKRKPVYLTTVASTKAVGLMMTIYPLMGFRRKTRIREILLAWKKGQRYARYRTHCPKGHLLVRCPTNWKIKRRRFCRKCNEISCVKYQRSRGHLFSKSRRRFRSAESIGQLSLLSQE